MNTFILQNSSQKLQDHQERQNPGGGGSGVFSHFKVHLDVTEVPTFMTVIEAMYYLLLSKVQSWHSGLYSDFNPKVPVWARCAIPCFWILAGHCNFKNKTYIEGSRNEETKHYTLCSNLVLGQSGKNDDP